MEFIQKDNPGINGYFRAVEDKKIAGAITYKWHGNDLLEIDHTEVNENREGEGIGQKLVEAVVHFVREKTLRSRLHASLPKVF